MPENTEQTPVEEQVQIFPDHHIALCNMLVAAAKQDAISLMRTKNAAGELRSVICVAKEDPRDESGMTFVPVGEIIEQEDIYSAYEPPQGSFLVDADGQEVKPNQE